ncbi:hypothetical protein HII31_06614 [Pseudocercospora fuligena]|uniref:F-box domain-containing protein n=1 Tax=Pseudocercospora fuligena TaxID=685502 RepID=A0A8H6VL24_9PEZI|nr:hypothetical protein HII31_06614 [Pseudocercospora fuligena]
MDDRLKELLDLLGEEDLPPRVPTPLLEESQHELEEVVSDQGYLRSTSDRVNVRAVHTTPGTQQLDPPSPSQTASASNSSDTPPLPPSTSRTAATEMEIIPGTITADQSGESVETSTKPSASSAADVVFGNEDVLELIFDILPMRDLLIVQRVTTTSRYVVRTRPKFQRRLFLEEGDLDDVHEDEMAEDTRYIQDLAAFPEEWIEDLPEQYYAEKITFNPLLVEQCVNIRGLSPLKFRAMPRILPELLDAKIGKKSSCRCMFFTQPPLRMETLSVNVNAKACEKAHMSIHFLSKLEEGFGDQHLAGSEVENLGAGKTLGAMVDALNFAVKKQCKYMVPRSDEYCTWTFGLAEGKSAALLYMEDFQEEDQLWDDAVGSQDGGSIKDDRYVLTDEEIDRVEEICDGKYVERGWLESVD